MPKPAQTAPDAPRECNQCGAPLPRRLRKGGTICRVCATRSAYQFLERVLVTRYPRGAVPRPNVA